MSTSLPDPAVLRAQAQRARASAARKAKREAKAAAIAKAERVAGMQKGRLDTIIERAVRQMKDDARKGYKGSRVHIASVEAYPSDEYYEAMRPIWDLAVEHFEKKYSAKLDYDHHTRMEGLMDPCMVPDGMDVYLVISWAGK